MNRTRPDFATEEARTLRTLDQLSTSAGRSLDPAELVRLVAEQAGAQLHGDAVALYLWDESTGQLNPAFSNDPRQPLNDQPLQLGEGAAGQAVLRRQSVVVDDYDEFDHAVAWAVARRLKSVQAVPLLLGDRTIGALVVRFYSARPDHGPEVERMLDLLAAQAAPALEAARLYAATTLQREHERALREITQALAENLDERQVLDLAVYYSTQLFKSPYARIWLIEPDGQLSCAAAEGFVHSETLKRRLSMHSTSGRVAQQQVVNLANAPSEMSWTFNREFGDRTGLGAYLGAGLWRAGESLGVLEVMRQAGNRFSDVEEQLLVSLANAVAVAVSNARTRAAVERLAREAEQRADALHRRDIILEAVAFAAEKLLSTPEWEQSIDDVLRQLGAATGVSRVYIVPAGGNETAAGEASPHEWTASGVASRADLPASGSYLEALGLGRWETILRAGGIVEGTLGIFPPAEQVTLAAQGVCSVVVVPIFAGSAWWGFIGFDDCAEERIWPPSAVEVLKTAAGTLGAAILRRRADAERLQLVREQAARVEAEAAQRRLAFLAEASQILAASLDYETSLQGVADLIVSGLADTCFVDIREPDGATRRIASSSRGGVVMHVANANDAEQLTEMVMRVGQPRLEPTALAVPLVTQAGISGALTWLASLDRPFFGIQDLELAQHLARRCALAIDNSRLYREARTAVSIRDEFLSVAAHELKTPMTSLRGYAQLLAREFEKGHVANPERARRAATTIQVQSDKLARLVAQLLDVSRIQSGKLAIERKPSDLSALVREVVEAARTQLRDHTILARLPSELWLPIDPLRIEQVVTNLIDNAIKYSPDGGQIDVLLACDADNRTVKLAVRDRGVGVPLEHRAHIFDRFYQAHAGGALTSMAGMGLGLYISRQIIELHGGSISAEFPDDGGTCIVFTLPH
jgi:signal transduction histidine kinase